mmetsp:Transcript_65067/g.187237  ORF Transcript_65067/g.187237 Transcript_65067/m.187237 type:complete len:273 (+) Transcript_65067:412-1230(+)
MATSSAFFRSSHGKPVRRSRRASTTTVSGCPGKTKAAVCKVRSNGETRMREGAGKPSRRSMLNSSCVCRAMTFPSPERGASRNASSCNTLTRARSASALAMALEADSPRAANALNARTLARFSSMLCIASPCLTKYKVLTTACSLFDSCSNVRIPTVVKPSQGQRRRSIGRILSSGSRSHSAIHLKSHASTAVGRTAGSTDNSAFTRALASSETHGQGSRVSSTMCCVCSCKSRNEAGLNGYSRESKTYIMMPTAHISTGGDTSPSTASGDM